MSPSCIYNTTDLGLGRFPATAVMRSGWNEGLTLKCVTFACKGVPCFYGRVVNEQGVGKSRE